MPESGSEQYILTMNRFKLLPKVGLIAKKIERSRRICKASMHGKTRDKTTRRKGFSMKVAHSENYAK